jgi:hypothetical protein
MPVPEPAWLARVRDKPKTKNTKRVVRYYSKIYRATPSWLDCDQHREIRKIYKRARKHGLSVDHIVPLSSPLVCGLHVPWNLQIMPPLENMNKSNTFWPNCPFEQGALSL